MKISSGVNLTVVVLYLLLILKDTGLVLPECTGDGFPEDWTTSYWFLTQGIKRKFSSKYHFTDYYTANGTVFGESPECESEYYDPVMGYYYYLFYYTKENVYSLNTSVQICHGFKRHHDIIKEYHEPVKRSDVLGNAVECKYRLQLLAWNWILTKYDSAYFACPFVDGKYHFTFSDDGNPDVCANQSSLGNIHAHLMSLAGCFDPSNVDSAHPYYTMLYCLASWKAEYSENLSKGDFIAVEAYGTGQWPYCGRYYIDSNGVITMSLYLHTSGGFWYPVGCLADAGYNFYYDDGENPPLTRMIFTPVAQNSVFKPKTQPPTTSTIPPRSTVTKTYVNMSENIPRPLPDFWSDLRNLDWYWWILTTLALALVILLNSLMIFLACREKKPLKQNEK